MPRKKTIWNKADRQRFMDLMNPWLVEHHARQDAKHPREYEVDTCAGPLTISIHVSVEINHESSFGRMEPRYPALMCRFFDAVLAREELPWSRSGETRLGYTGKWNFHWSPADTTPEEAFRQFASEFTAWCEIYEETTPDETTVS